MSTKIQVRTPDGGTDGSVDLPAEVFDVEANVALMHQVVVGQLAAARQGTHSTKTRGDVRGGGRKPYRQKGTGRARQGSIRAPQFAGGGVAHGPTPRDYTQKTPKKMKAAALRGALSDRARSGRVHVISGVVDDQKPSTKAARAVVEAITDRARVLVVVSRGDDVAWLSLRNLPTVHVITPDQLNTYDVLVNDDVVFTTEALNDFVAATTKTPAAVEVAQAGTKPAAKRPTPRAGKPAAKADDADRQAEATATARSTAKTAGKADETTATTAATKAGTKAAKAAKAEPTAPASRAATKSTAKADGPHGPGSHDPLPGGGEPEGFPIKGNASSKLYHLPGTAAYKRTDAEVWFATEDAARAAGFQLPPSQRSAKGSAAKENKQ